MRPHLALLACVVAACARTSAPNPPAPAPKTEPLNLTLGGAVAKDEPEPPPDYHPHPEIPPDDLAAASDTEPPGPCHQSPPPEPPPPPKRSRLSGGPPVTNHIPPAVIMAPIRARAACFRACYEDGLARNPALAGRLSIRFVVDRDGWVRRARVDGGSLADPRVAACVARAFVGVSYPAPETAPFTITVVYPLTFGASD